MNEDELLLQWCKLSNEYTNLAWYILTNLDKHPSNVHDLLRGSLVSRQREQSYEEACLEIIDGIDSPIDELKNLMRERNGRLENVLIELRKAIGEHPTNNLNEGGN